MSGPEALFRIAFAVIFTLLTGLRWAGAAVGITAVCLIAVVHAELGKNFSPTLRLRPNHSLVTTGLYGWARHPIYTAYFLLFAGSFLLSANWVIGATGMGIILTHMTIRVRSEESMLLGRFVPLPRCMRIGAHGRLRRRASGRL